MSRTAFTAQASCSRVRRLDDAPQGRKRPRDVVWPVGLLTTKSGFNLSAQAARKHLVWTRTPSTASQQLNTHRTTARGTGAVREVDVAGAVDDCQEKSLATFYWWRASQQYRRRP